AGDTWRSVCRTMSGDIVYDLAMAGEEHVYASSESMGLWHLDPVSGEWRRLSALPDRIRVSFAVDPGNPDVIVAGDTIAHRSDDGGMTWYASNMNGSSVMNGMGFDRVDSRYVYCGRTSLTDSSGVWASQDNGASWLRKTTNHAGFLASDPFTAGTVFATIWVPPSHFSLSRSVDFGSNWENAGISYPVAGMAADPSVPGRFYICYDGTAPVVARTDDWGGQWVTSLLDDSVKALAVSPATGDVYAASDGMFVSSDQGATWEEVSAGLIDGRSRTIGINLENGTEQVYLGTEKCGLYKWMPVDADAPSVDLLSPDGGETLHYGESYDITWTAADNERVQYCDLFLSPDSGATWPVVVAGAVDNTGSFQWSIPLVHSNSCRIKITAYDPSWNYVSDESSDDFTIIAPTFTPTFTPTRTPTPTATPTPTPTPFMLEMRLHMPDSHFSPGRECFLWAEIHNPLYYRPEVPVFIVLEAAGSYWMAPSWTGDMNDLDYYKYSLAPGDTTIVVLPPFTWPDLAASATGLHFIAFCCDPAMTELTSNVDIWEFGYGPE
ncbi:MAG TPA: hypothetical protein PLV45_10685, partial [bacterium]|nr:hypothetical protein [bacterium]